VGRPERTAALANVIHNLVSMQNVRAGASSPRHWPPQNRKSRQTPINKVSATIDQNTRPGAMVSGRVTFSDGEKASWFPTLSPSAD
jgi:hypothetical protein